MQKERIVYFDYLRIIAAFAIIVLHIAAAGFVNSTPHSSEWKVFNAFNALTRWGVPVFVMISGALFLGKEQPIEKLFKKNILRLVVSLVFWIVAYNVLHALQAVWAEKSLTAFFSSFSIEKVMEGEVHFWFLYMLIGLYIIVPFLNEIAKNKTLTIYFISLSVLFAFVIPQIIIALKEIDGTAAEFMEYVISNMKMFLVLGFSGYFLLGYLLNNATISKKTEIIIYAFGIIGAIETVITSSFDNMNVNVLLMSIAVFVFAKKHLNKVPQKGRYYRGLLRCSKSSFGVYLIHPYVIELLGMFGVAKLNNAILQMLVLPPVVFMITMSISLFLNKIPFVKNWIV